MKIRIFRYTASVEKIFLFLYLFNVALPTHALVIDHRHRDITQIPEAAVRQAKESLHIAYGHTSHGSQLVDGMRGLVDFMNGRGYPHNLYDFGPGSTDGRLDFYDTPFSGADDLGSPDFTAWEAATRSYLDGHPGINTVIWSWCGQVSGASQADINTYLNLMSGLERDYPGVWFVYMTGHLDGSGEEGQLNRRNQQIRDYCEANDKILFDFADIESYDPDGQVNYMALYANDNCDYDSDSDGSLDQNWAINWQNSHTEGSDWYQCGAAHSQPLNANQKAWAAWWLWARLGGWAGPVADETPPAVPQNLSASNVSETQVDLSWDASTDTESGVARYRIYRDDVYAGYSADSRFTDTGLTPGTDYVYSVSAVNGSGLESDRSSTLTVHTPSDGESPSKPVNLTAVVVSSSQIDLAWDAASDNTGVTGYRIYRDGQLIASTAETSYSDTGLSPATSYIFQVSAFDAAGNESTHSDPAQNKTLDPSQETRAALLEDPGDVDDAFLFENDPDGHYGSEPYVDTIDRFILRFSLPPELSGKQILTADLGLYVWNQTGFQADQFMEIFRVTRNWDENEVTWNRATASEEWAVPGGDYETGRVVARIQHQTDADHVFYPEADIRDMVQSWTDGEYENYGIMILNESQTGIGLKASEYDEGARPYLDLSWMDKTATTDTTATDTTATDTTATKTAESPKIVSSMRLYPNYPNPFNPVTTIRFGMVREGPVILDILNTRGQRIRRLIDRSCTPGEHHIVWDGRDDNGIRAASGSYLYRIEQKENRLTGRLQLVK